MITIENVFCEKYPDWATYDSEGKILYNDNDEVIPIDVDAVSVRLGEMIDEFQDYKYWRVKEYPSIEDQLDTQYWDSINGTTVWLDTIAGIKDKFPKE